MFGTSTAAWQADSNGRHQEDEEGEKKHLLPEAMVIAQMPMIE